MAWSCGAPTARQPAPTWWLTSSPGPAGATRVIGDVGGTVYMSANDGEHTHGLPRLHYTRLYLPAVKGKDLRKRRVAATVRNKEEALGSTSYRHL